MIFFFFLVILLMVFLLLSGPSEERPRRNSGIKEEDEDQWEFGDVWKQGLPDEASSDEEIAYVEILRGDTGEGYDDSVMLDYIGYLSSRGIRATYDSVPLALEFGGAIKTYVLKVEAGKEQEARAYLQEKESNRP